MPRTTTTEPCVAIIKHANPCGIAIGADVAEAHRKAHACDPLSAFGGVIAVNRPVSVAMAEQVAEIFTEVIVAPAYEDGAVEILARKKNIRVLRCPDARQHRSSSSRSTAARCSRSPTASRPTGDDPANWTLATGERCPTPNWPSWPSPGGPCRAVKSNAILLAKDGASVGVGMGQVNRVDSAKLAVERAGEERRGGRVRRLGRVLPVPRRPGDPDRGRRQGRGPARWFGP